MKYRIVYSNRKTIGLYVNGYTLTVRAPFGTSTMRIDSLVEQNMDWIQKSMDAQKKKKAAEPMLNVTRESMLKKAAKKYCSAKSKYYSDLMNLKYGRIKITSAKKRFGSCNSEGNICFSFRVMLYPEYARDYVIVHELAHLLEMNHSSEFYKIIESVMPDYKERRKLLKKAPRDIYCDDE